MRPGDESIRINERWLISSHFLATCWAKIDEIQIEGVSRSAACSSQFIMPCVAVPRAELKLNSGLTFEQKDESKRTRLGLGQDCAQAQTFKQFAGVD